MIVTQRTSLGDPRWSRRHLATAAISAALAVALSACWSPQYHHPACGAHGECPGSLTCVAGFCEDHAPIVDAAPDPGCTQHAQCPVSNVCLPDGACADPQQVAYVSATGSGTACTQAAPCGSVASAVATNRPIAKLSGTVTGPNNKIQGRTLIVLADPGASLAYGGGAAILDVSSGADIAVYDLTFRGGGGNNNELISAESGKLTLVRVTLDGGDRDGLSVDFGATVVIAQSTIRGSGNVGISAQGGSLTITQSIVRDNTRGGITVNNANFTIVGNVFFHNGGTNSAVGGLAISNSSAISSRLEFNSFSQNSAPGGAAPGMQCSAPGFTARNNILSDNGISTSNQVSGTCAHAYSIMRPGMLPSGPGNLAVDPMFVDPSLGNLHLKPGSPAQRAADPSSDLTGLAARDLDGDVRVAPADIGADQLAL